MEETKRSHFFVQLKNFNIEFKHSKIEPEKQNNDLHINYYIRICLSETKCLLRNSRKSLMKLMISYLRH